MAEGDNTIRLEVLLDQAQVSEQLEDILKSSKNVLDALASSIDPLSVMFGGVVEQIDQGNAKLLEMLRIMDQVAQTEGQTRGKFNRDVEIERLTILARQEGEIKAQAVERLIALEEQLINQITKHNNLTADRIHKVQQLEAVQKALSNTSEETIKKESEGNKNLRTQIQELINISKARTDISADALVRLQQYQNSLNTATLRYADNQKRAAFYSSLLVKVNAEVARSQGLVNKEAEQYVDTLSKMARGDYSFSADALEELIQKRDELREAIEAETVAEHEKASALKQVEKLESEIAKEKVKLHRQAMEQIDQDIKLSRSGTEESMAALDRLVEKRGILREAIDAGTLSEEEYADAVKQLDRIVTATSDRRVKQIRAEIEFRDEEMRSIRNQISLAKTKTQASTEAIEWLKVKAKEYREEIDSGTLSLERRAEAAESLRQIELGLWSAGGVGRRAMRRQRALEGPDPYGTLLDFGRIAQDAPWGLMGIANNLGPFFDNWFVFYHQFKEIPTLAGRVGAALTTLGKGLILSPIGWIALLNVFTSFLMKRNEIIQFFTDIINRTSEAEKRVRKLTEEIDKLVSQQFNLDIDYKAVIDQFDTISAELEDLDEQFKFWSKNRKVEFSEEFIPMPLAEQAYDRLLRFIGIMRKELREIDEERKRASDIQTGIFNGLSELHAHIKASGFAVRKGLIDPFREATEENIKSLKEQEIQYRLFIAEVSGTIDDEISVRRELFDFETDQQREELERQLTNAQVAYEEQSKAYAEALAEMTAKGEMFTAAQMSGFNAVFESLRNQITASQNALISFGRKIPIEWDEILKGIRESRNKDKDNTQRWIDSILDMQLDLERARLDIQRDSFTKSAALIELDTETRRIELQRQLRDFEGTGEYMVRMRRAINDRIAFLDIEAQRKLQDARREFDIKNLNEQNQIEDLRYEIQLANLNRLAGFRGEMQDREITRDRQLLAWQRQINELRLQDQTEHNQQMIELLEERMEAERRASGRDLDDIRRRAMADEIRALEDWSLAAQTADLDALQASVLYMNNAARRARMMATIEEDRKRMEAARRLEMNIQAALELESQQARDQALLQAHAIYHAELQAIEAESYAARRELRTQYLSDDLNAHLDHLNRTLSIMSQTTDLFYQNWASARKKELIDQGVAEEEANEVIEREGQKRLAFKRKMAKLEIVASTALSAMKAFEAGWSMPGPFWAKAAAAYGGAAAAILYGAARYAAVDRDTIAGGGGKSFTIRTGEVTPPGLQEANSLVFNRTFDPATGSFSSATWNQDKSNERVVEAVGKLGDKFDEMVDAWEGRPLYADVPEQNAARIIESGQSYEKRISRD